MMIATAIATTLLFASPIMGFTAVSPHRPQHPSSSLLSSSSAVFKKSTLPTTYCNSSPPSSSSSSSLHAIREATFGMGCFWEPAESLLKQPGVLSTTVGYTGCTNPSKNKPPPTYDTVCFGNDYVEAVRVVYDDTIISYTQLLNQFFEYQKPGYARQYSSVIFVNDNNADTNDEKKMANEWKNNGVQNKLSRSKDNLSIDIVQIEPLSKFYRAESYHQRYWEKQRVRAGLAAILLAGSYGAFDQLELFGSSGIVVGDLNIGGYAFDTICNGVFLIGAAWMILERLVVQDVRELKDGELIQEVI